MTLDPKPAYPKARGERCLGALEKPLAIHIILSYSVYEGGDWNGKNQCCLGR
jgi:hypothetical protein